MVWDEHPPNRPPLQWVTTGRNTPPAPWAAAEITLFGEARAGGNDARYGRWTISVRRGEASRTLHTKHPRADRWASPGNGLEAARCLESLPAHTAGTLGYLHTGGREARFADHNVVFRIAREAKPLRGSDARLTERRSVCAVHETNSPVSHAQPQLSPLACQHLYVARTGLGKPFDGLFHPVPVAVW